MAQRKGIRLKKRYGQHFLKDEQYLHSMFDAVKLTDKTSVLEIGCGEGLLTRAILRHPVARLWVYEIDPEWAEHVKTTINDDRLKMHLENVLDSDLDTLKPDAPWTVLANLPYQVTFPILHRFQEYRRYLKEGVVMVQEEVSQKIVKTSGRGYGYSSLFFQHFFEWKLLEKIPPSAFYPPPKVFSRLLYFKTIENPTSIPNEEGFWKFVMACFKQPRRTMRNNLKSSHYESAELSEELLSKRAQQLDMKELLEIWDGIKKS